MKHPGSREFFACWDKTRGNARAPDRCDLDPEAVRERLGDIFVLSYEHEAGFPFRVAGTRVCALLGRDLKDKSFSELFTGESRRQVEDVVAFVAEEMLPAVAGVTASSQAGTPAHLELLLLPFNNRAHVPVSLTGLLAPFETVATTLSDFTLTSWRYLHPPERFVPRALRKLAIARGFMVYEGLR
ncbi:MULTISPECIES: PAS domain-containing protein [Bradyrhizobium]|uniref:PAS domain-containing protein n=1 Tax=Bradyrhizobium elkanii TaxID=29448 RepID=UPI0004236BA3|nr:PAS domain-containing protein [Bradyrhizobium elkanii]